MLHFLPWVLAHREKLFVKFHCFEACTELAFVYGGGSSFDNFDGQNAVLVYNNFFFSPETTQVKVYL